MGASAPGGPHVDDTQAWEDSATAGAVVRRVHGGPITNPNLFPFWASSLYLLERNDTPAWEDSATTGAVAGHVHGGPIANPAGSFAAFFSPLARTERLARVGRCCAGGRRRRARSWGTHYEPDFSFLAFFNPFWPSSVHCLEQSKRRRGTTLRRSSSPTCSGLRASGLGREIIAVSGPHYVRHTFGSGSESLRLGSNCLRRTHIVETEPGAVRIDRADIAPRVRQFASEHRAYGACGVPFTRKTDVILVGLASAVRCADGRKKTRCVNLRTIAGYALSILAGRDGNADWLCAGIKG